MILNREIHHRNKKKSKNIREEEEEENEEEEEEIEVKETKKKKKHNKKHKEEFEEKEEEEELEEENDFSDLKAPKKLKNIIPDKNKLFYILIAASVLLLILIIILIIKIINKAKEENGENIELNLPNENNNSSKSSNSQPEINNSPNQSAKENQESKEENKEENKEEKKEDNAEKERLSKEMQDFYNQQGNINIIKYYKENILKQEYKLENIEQKNHIHISTSFNDNNINNYIIHIASILHQADKEKSFIHIHMMDAGDFNYDTFIKLSKMICNLNNNTEIIVYNANEGVKAFNIRPDRADKFKEEYAKLYAFKILKDIKKIIFINGDNIMVQKDLNELYQLKMDDIYARGISEQPGLITPMDWYDKYIMDNSHFINCGVLLINLELCQKDSLYEKAIELNNVEFYTKTECPVQDILNVLMRKKIEFFHPRFNTINFYENPSDKNDESKWYPYMLQTIKMGEKNNHFYSKEELLEADNDPVIVQYYWDKLLNKVIAKYEEEKKNYGKLCGLEQ